ncbi:solute carrier family 41 [Entomortierella parvispora]|uniref:Solute carrier family 41 n=1 Tax=Entomortierella parvispora TaxID=205924 RepID=A0A9P3M0B2_9FUNG|nr:solute carrier family 41 [Entomortierella parvispora]
MSRLLSSAGPSFAQASYTPLLNSRHSQDLTQDEDDLDPDSSSHPPSSSPHSSRQQSQNNRQRTRTTSFSMNHQPTQHTLGGDSDSDDQEFDHHADGFVHPASDPASDSQSTIVSVHDGESVHDPDSSYPLKKGRPESFEYSEPGHDRDSYHFEDEERGQIMGGSSDAVGTDDSSEKGLWMQASTTLVIAVSGLICAGWLLDEVQHWPVFIEISELIILIPILLNLKGNLEMNLASRLSTASNMGLLDSPTTRNSFIIGNLALLQLQSLTVASVAGLFSFALGMIVHPTTNNLEEIALMISSSMLCASISSFVLGSFMCGLVLICRHFKVNPDNIACPLASSFGDLVTLMILSGCAVFLVKYIQTPLCLILLLVLIGMIPGWLYYVRRNEFVSEVVKEGWGPVFAAMVIASTAGLTLERYINQFPGMAMISPVLNGLTGNIGSIYASRISTAVHANVKENYRSTEKTLFLVHIPIEILFLGVIGLLGLGDVQWSAGVVIGYAGVALTLVVIALALAKWITMAFWRWGYDPDNYALPILTSLIDVLGTALLVVGFWALGYGGDATPQPLE